MTAKQYKKFKENVYFAEENFISKIHEFFLAIAINKDGKEGVIAQIYHSDIFPVEQPLMGSSKADKEDILKKAKRCAKDSGMKVRVLRFTKCETIAEF